MKSNKLVKPKPGPPTVDYLDISEIRDDMVILKDGTVRSVLMVSSINFALKSEDEQESIIQAYNTFLNSLEFNVQIVIQSRRMNIDNYLNSLIDYQKKTENELLRQQIGDYRDFITELVELGEIMQKRFYVVVPYDPLSDKKKNFFARVGEVFSPAAAAKLNQEQLRDRIEKLSRRVDVISSQLGSMGLSSVRLDTQGLIELYYNVYNPDIFETERMSDISEIRHEETSQVEDSQVAEQEF